MFMFVLAETMDLLAGHWERQQCLALERRVPEGPWSGFGALWELSGRHKKSNILEVMISYDGVGWSGVR